MPIIFRKHLGSDNEDDANDHGDDSKFSIPDFLGGNDVDQEAPPPTKKRKLNAFDMCGARGKHQAMPSSIANTNQNQKGKKKTSTTTKTRKKIVNKAWTLLHSVSSSFVTDPAQTAQELRKMMLLSLKTTQSDLNFTFEPSHFIQIHDEQQLSPDIGSLDVLKSFLKTHFKNIACANDDADNSINDSKQNNEDDKRPEWMAYTKSMQVIIVSPSVQRAVETMKALRKMRVTHSFYHKKQIKQMTEEEYEEYQQSEASVIAIRICELFGKHRKISEQQVALHQKSWHLGIGGINRIDKLCQTKHLKLKQCSLVIVDLQKNAKEQCLLDMSQLRNELCGWLKQYVLPQLAQKKTRIAFF